MLIRTTKENRKGKEVLIPGLGNVEFNDKLEAEVDDDSFELFQAFLKEKEKEPASYGIIVDGESDAEEITKEEKNDLEEKGEKVEEETEELIEPDSDEDEDIEEELEEEKEKAEEEDKGAKSEEEAYDKDGLAELEKKLSSMKKTELQDLAKEHKLSEKEYKYLNKPELIKYILSK